MKKDFTRDNVSYEIKSAFYDFGFKPFAKVKKNVIRNVNELLVYKNEYLIPKKDLKILNTRIIEFIDAFGPIKDKEELNEQLTNLIMAYCQGIIREQNIINILYK